MTQMTQISKTDEDRAVSCLHRVSNLCLLCNLWISFLYRSGGAELPVAGVAEAGDDVPDVVQVRVEGGEVQRHVRVGALQGGDALRGRDDAGELHPRGAGPLQDVD